MQTNLSYIRPLNYNLKLQFIFCYRAVHKLDGQKIASQYDCLFHETSAADDFHSVQQLFHLLIRYVTKSQERQVSMQPLYIAEDSKTSILSSGVRPFRRTKSPGNSNEVIKDSTRSQDKDNRLAQRRMPSTLKSLKSRFNIFNWTKTNCDVLECGESAIKRFYIITATFSKYECYFVVI